MMMLRAWHTYHFHPFLLAAPFKFHPNVWEASVHIHFRILSRDVNSDSSLGACWAAQGLSQSCPEATCLISCLCAWGCCPAERWTVAPVFKRSRFSSRISLYLAAFIFPSILTSLLSSCLWKTSPLHDAAKRSMFGSWEREFCFWLVDYCRDCFPSKRFSFLHRETLELWQSGHRVLGYLADWGPSLLIAQFIRKGPRGS